MSYETTKVLFQNHFGVFQKENYKNSKPRESVSTTEKEHAGNFLYPHFWHRHRLTHWLSLLVPTLSISVRLSLYRKGARRNTDE